MILKYPVIASNDQFDLVLANIVLNSKLCCCVAGEHNSGFDPPENMFFMCNRGGNVQKTTF